MRVDDIQTRKLKLTDAPEMEENPHRPNLAIWAEGDEHGKLIVSLSLCAMFGQPLRFVELSQEEARTLAVLLKHVADDIDALD